MTEHGDTFIIVMCCIGLIAYVAYFSVLKFRRVKAEKKAFAKITKLVKEGPKEGLTLPEKFKIQLISQNFIGCFQCTLLFCFREHDALLVSFSASYDLL